MWITLSLIYVSLLFKRGGCNLDAVYTLVKLNI